MSSSASELKFYYPNKFIRAGAGAGKTTCLISTFFDFAEQFKQSQKKYPKIVITTFTRKATQEVKERLMLQALKKEDTELFQYINKKSSVHISTIHSLLSLFLTKYHDLINLSSDLNLIDDFKNRKISFRILKNIFKNKPENLKLLEHYSFKELLNHLEKTAQFYSEHDEINLLSQEQLVAERDSRVSKVKKTLIDILSEPIPDSKPWQNYFNYLTEVLAALENIDFNRLKNLAEELDRKPAFYKNKPAFNIQLHEELVAILDESDCFIQESDTDEFILEFVSLNKMYLNLFYEYYEKTQNLKTTTGQITISDLELLTLKLFKLNPHLLNQFSSEFDYYMIDEFQDTSPLQVKILSYLIDLKPHFIVGDPQQSIYLFRGARSEVFLKMEEKAKIEKYELTQLQTNYRSEPQLMSFINSFFYQFSNKFLPMNLKQQNSNFLQKTQAYFIKSNNQDTAVINQIRRLCNLGVSPSDICVLSKNNSALMSLAQTAQQYNVKVQLQVAAGFDKKREILDLVSFLRFLVNPHDSKNLIQLLRSPWFMASDEEIVKIRHSSKTSFWLQLKEQKNIDYKSLNDYQLIFEKYGVMEALQKFILKQGLLESSQFIDASGKYEANVWKFVAQLKAKLQSADFNLNTYLSQQFTQLQSDLASNLSEAQPVLSPDRVSLMTIHSSKGLQFKHVIVLGFSDFANTTKLLPLVLDPTSKQMSLSLFWPDKGQLISSEWGLSQRRAFNTREIEEYERLLYVAMTRAEETLSLISENKKSYRKDSWFKKMTWPDQEMLSMADSFDSSISWTAQSFEDNDSAVSMVSSEPANSIVRSQYKNPEPTIDVIQENSSASTSAINLETDKVKLAIISNLNKAEKGIELHRFFESLKYLPLETILSFINDSEKIIFKYLLGITEIPLTQIINNGHVEWGFGFKLDGMNVQKQIDAWGIVEDTVYIIDYKTGSSEFLQKAFDQMSFYAFCLLKMGLIKNNQTIVIAAVYPVEQKTFTKTLSESDLLQINT